MFSITRISADTESPTDTPEPVAYSWEGDTGYLGAGTNVTQALKLSATFLGKT
jgi:hypothetical protein